MKIITRHNKHSLLQVKDVMSHFPNVEYELIDIDTARNKQKEVIYANRHAIKDSNTHDILSAIFNNEADIAILSAIAIPYPLPPGIEVIALIESSEKADSLITRNGIELADNKLENKIPHQNTSERPYFNSHLLQGKHAVVASSKVDDEIRNIFSHIDVRTTYGSVKLVGFGPGDPELITVKGQRLLAQADIIFYDDLTNEAFLKNFKAEKVYVGKRSHKHSHAQEEINLMMYFAAIKGKNVVRLKGGDPMIFAHGREEIDYMKENMVDVEVIPGISSGIALASLTQIPLTHRGMSRSVAFVLGHSTAIQTPDADTLLYFMGGAKICIIAETLIKAGKSEDTPVALVSNISLPNQREVFSTLGELRYAIYYETPVLIIIGQVVGFEAYTHNQLTCELGDQDIQDKATFLNTEAPYNINQKGKDLKKYDKLIFTSPSAVNVFKTIYTKDDVKHLLIIAKEKNTFETILTI